MSNNFLSLASRSLRQWAVGTSSSAPICALRARGIHCLNKPSAPRASASLHRPHRPQKRLSSFIGASTRSLRWSSSSALSDSSSATQSTSTNAPSSSPSPEPTKIEPRLSLTFTCTAQIPVPDSATGAGDVESAPKQPCSHRSTHTFTKNAYQKGIVIIACPSCKNRHLIADNLGWFKNQDGSEGGKTVEDFMKAKGEEVKRGALIQTAEGDVEFVP